MDKTKETIIDLLEFEGIYKISDGGKIFSLPKAWVGGKGSLRSHDGKRLKTNLDRKGYEIITLRKDGKKRTLKIHRLVALHFIPNPENKPKVNHKNGNKSDNNVLNLEWATDCENMQHAVATGLLAPQVGERHGGSKITEDQAIAIKNSPLPPKEISVIYGISISHIAGIKAGTKWKHLQSLTQHT